MINSYIGPNHNLAGRLFSNILETGKVFGNAADISELKGEYVIVGGWDVGKSSIINYLSGRDEARVVGINEKATSHMNRYDNGEGLILWDTPPLNDGGYDDDVNEAKRLENITLQFLKETKLPIIYTILPYIGRKEQVVNLNKLHQDSNIKQVIFTQCDDPNSNENRFKYEYGEMLPSECIPTSTKTGEGFHKLIENLMS